jgi:E3 ubiquitin-protein ligase HUWE1
VLTSQRWTQEVKVLHGEFVAERLTKFTNHVILALLPAAVEAIKQAKIREEQEEGIRQEALARTEAEAAEEKAKAEQAAKEEAGEAARREAEEAVARQAGPVPSAVSTLEEDQNMEDAASLPFDADSDMTDATAAEPSNVEPHHESSPNAPETSAESSSAPTAPPERVTVMIHGSPVDITETGIDPTFLEALPDDMREEVLNQHVRDQRAARIERPPDSQISSEFLDALPPEIRAEIIQQEAVQRAQTRPGVGSEMDNASFLASLDPTLRQTVLMEQDEGFIQTLPSHMLAEVGAYREGQQSQRTPRRVIPAVDPVAPRKFTPQHDAIQLLDKVGVAVLVRLLFFPHVLKKTLLFKVLVNLCENAKTRTELFNLLLNILQDGTGDLAAVDKSFAQMSFRNSKPLTSKALGKQKAGPEYLTGLALPSSQSEAVPDLIAQRCLEGLTYIVSANEMSSLFFLTEHELPAGLRRTASKKGKGKEKQIPQTHYPIVLLLSLLDRQSLLRTPAIMESVVGLLATVTRPLASLKNHTEPAESDASRPTLAPEPPSDAPESTPPIAAAPTVETPGRSTSEPPPAPSEPTAPTVEVPAG